MKVLIVEDDPVIRDALQELLQHWGLVTEECAEGLEALTLLEAGSFDLVLLDLNLPGLDGLEVCRRLRRLPINQPLVLMLTARGDEADRIVGLEIGADDYLPKTFSTRELLARLRAVTRRSVRV